MHYEEAMQFATASAEMAWDQRNDKTYDNVEDARDSYRENVRERWSNQTDSGQNRLSPSDDRAHLRAVTYPGIAAAMAAQWNCGVAMNVRHEIEARSSADDKPVLLWLFDRYHMDWQWRFVARCEHVRYGPMSYETHRVWFPTTEGRVLYAAMVSP